MKIWSSEHVFDHPWNTVADAAWRKYPNPINRAVTAVDVVKQEVNDGVLMSQRVLQSRFSVPGWVSKLIGLTDVQYSHERSEIDPEKQEMTLQTYNLNCNYYINVDEKLIYKPHPDDSQKTVLQQQTTVNVTNVPLADYCERIFLAVYENNAKTGRQAIDWVIANCKREFDEFSTKFNIAS